MTLVDHLGCDEENELQRWWEWKQVTVVVQRKDGGGLDHSGAYGAGEKWFD